MQNPRINKIAPKKLIGMFFETCLAENKTKVLWSQFMPRVKEILNRVNPYLYSVQQFDKNTHFDSFTPYTRFKKWAAVEVTSFTDTPERMANLSIAGGLYAVFLHKGPASNFPRTSQYIFNHWLPNSNCELDHRAHFEIMGENYLGPEDPNSLEEVWVPVSYKSKT